MSSRTAEKTRRREERLERARADKRAERKAHVRNVGLAALFGLFAVGGTTVLFLVGGGEGRGAAAVAKGSFNQHYAGLERRRKAAHIPTMMQTMSSTAHFHPMLRLYANGKALTVPADIGIDPHRDGMQMAGLHTHDTSGTIHVEGVKKATLGQLFEIWGVAFSHQRLGPYRRTATNAVRMWVDGKPSTAFQRLGLRDGQRIVVSFGAKGARAPAGVGG